MKEQVPPNFHQHVDCADYRFPAGQLEQFELWGRLERQARRKLLVELAF